MSIRRSRPLAMPLLIATSVASCALMNGNFIGGPAVIDGPFMVAGSLKVGGPATVHGPVRARKIIVGGPVYTIPGGEAPGPAGESVVGPFLIGGPLTVFGPLTVDGTLIVGGPLTAETSSAYSDVPPATQIDPPAPSDYSQTPQVNRQ